MTLFKDKVALITGSTSGMGLEMAKSFAKKHAHVVLNGFGSEEEIEKIKEELSTLGNGTVLYHGANLLKEDEIADLIDFTKKTFGRLDILVNNAGMQFVSPIDTFPAEKWDQVIGLNLTAAFHTTRHALPIMRAQKFGRIINISSAHGLVGSIGKSAYVASKHGIIGLTKVTALETAQEDITCNAICPGFVLTPLAQAQIHENMKCTGRTFEVESTAFVSDKHPSQKFVSAAEIAGACLFLASPETKQMRGAQMVIDGAWTII